MLLAFSKMHGLGNDFVVFDGVRQRVALNAARIRLLADRHFGVGCDQVLVVEASDRPGVDFRYRIYNADGGEVEQCGNGARCFVRFVRAQGLTDKAEIAVETLSGVIRPRLEPDGQVTVDMGVPCFDPGKVPFAAPGRQDLYNLELTGQTVSLAVLSMGNPHAVLIVDDVERAPVTALGPLIEGHGRFPQRVNAGFMQIVDRAHIRLRVYERGAGETLACGSGACAAVAAGRVLGRLDETVEVALRGGCLRVFWEGEGAALWMTGPVAHVFDGTIDLERLAPQGEE